MSRSAGLRSLPSRHRWHQSHCDRLQCLHLHASGCCARGLCSCARARGSCHLWPETQKKSEAGAEWLSFSQTLISPRMQLWAVNPKAAHQVPGSHVRGCACYSHSCAAVFTLQKCCAGAPEPRRRRSTLAALSDIHTFVGVGTMRIFSGARFCHLESQQLGRFESS